MLMMVNDGDYDDDGVVPRVRQRNIAQRELRHVVQTSSSGLDVERGMGEERGGNDI